MARLVGIGFWNTDDPVEWKRLDGRFVLGGGGGQLGLNFLGYELKGVCV